MRTIYCRILFLTHPTSASGRPPLSTRKEGKSEHCELGVSQETNTFKMRHYFIPILNQQKRPCNLVCRAFPQYYFLV